MTRTPAGRLIAVVLLAVAVGGCTYFPTVADTGSPRMEPRNGRLVRTDAGAVCYFDLESTGGYGDTLLAAESRVARRVEIQNADGTPAGELQIRPETRVVFIPGGLRIALSELTQPLVPGDGVIVTLIFAKSGRVGVISRVE